MDAGDARHGRNGCRKRRHEAQEAIRYVNGEQAIGREPVEIHLEGFAREEVHGYGIRRKCVDDEIVEAAGRLLLDCSAGSATGS